MVHSIMLQLFRNEYKLFFLLLLLLLPTRINKYDTHLSSSIVNSKAQGLTLQLNFTAICTVNYFDFLFCNLKAFVPLQDGFDIQTRVHFGANCTAWVRTWGKKLKLTSSWHEKINKKVIFHCTDTSRVLLYGMAPLNGQSS